MERIHVTGFGPRTGTTLIAEMMIACFDIDAFDEHEATVFNLRRDCAIYLSKWPSGMMAARRRLRFDKHFHIICMLRDPRDVVTSRHSQDVERYWAPLRLWKRGYRQAKPILDHPRVVALRYEDLVSEPDTAQAKIAARFPFLRKTASFSEFSRRASPADRAVRALGGVRAPSPESVGNWRGHLPRLAGQLARHGSVTDDLIELGYESDDAWLGALEGVEPDMAPSHWPETDQRSLGERMVKVWNGARNYARLAGGGIERLAGRTVG